MRYNADGTIDSGFGQGGFVYMNWNGLDGAFGNAYAIAVQKVTNNDGTTTEKIIVAGSAASGGLRVDRYNSDGSIDTSFGGGAGKVIVSNGGYALAVAIQPGDQKILTIGDVGVMVRLQVNGSLDTSFGTGGIIQTSLKARSIAIQSTGRIITCGGTTGGQSLTFVSRFNTNGSPDDGGRADATPGDAFGTSGKAQVASCLIARVDTSDRILAAGGAAQANATKKSSYSDFAVKRLNANGSTDTTFGVNGTRTVDFSGLNDTLWSIDVDSLGRIILSGETNSASGTNSGIARLGPSGSLDASFGQNGRSVSDFSTAKELMRSGFVVVDPICGCEKYVTVGVAELGGPDYAIAARYIL
jgi:uncharacterized delta-60 repeat protein